MIITLIIIIIIITYTNNVTQYSKAFKRQPHKIVKHTQTILRQQPTNFLSVFDHFVWLVLKGLIVVVMLIGISNDKITYVEDFQSHKQKKASLNVLQNF